MEEIIENMRKELFRLQAKHDQKERLIKHLEKNNQILYDIVMKLSH